MSRRPRQRYDAGAADLQPGQRRLLQLGGKAVGVFNVAGAYFALHNRCPHMGGNLCAGPVTGTTLPGEHVTYQYGREGEILRCSWHGWEFEIQTGRCLADPRLRARRYAVTVEGERIIVHI